MKTLIQNTLLFVLLITAPLSFGATIGVAPIKTFGLYADSDIAATLARIELEKLQKYQVLDLYDMNEIENPEDFFDCYGKSCLISYGKALNTDYILSGNIDDLGPKIVITLKLINIDQERIVKTQTSEFESIEKELQHMLRIVLREMHDLTIDESIKNQLTYRSDPIINPEVNKVNNAGPRMGVAYTVGSFNEFATRSENYGGLGIAPIVTNLGYQIEGEYVGTKNFSALFEGLINLTGLEQGQFIPSVSLLNGFRFGEQGWEFAFGPSFGFSRTSVGFFTSSDKNLLGENAPRYWTESEFNNSAYAENNLSDYGYSYSRNLDKRGGLDFSTRWIMAFGRTFKAGSLNIPVNVFYSSRKGGGMVGFSMGFNISKKVK